MTLLSFRHRPGRGPAVELTARQQGLVSKVASSIENGSYRMTPTRCVCGAEHALVISRIDRYGIALTTVMCADCATLRFDPYLDADSLAHFYTHHYQDMYGRVPDPAGYFARQRGYGSRLLTAVASALPERARVLEVGCGAGGALSAFQEAGHEVFGCDYSAPLVEYGRSKGIAGLALGDLDDAGVRLGLRTGQVDLIFLHHVFEHLLSPVEWLASASRFVSEQGLVVVAVPDAAELARYESPDGDLRKFLHIAHKFNFTMQGLERCAALAGMSAKAIDVPRSKSAPEMWVAFSRRELAGLGRAQVWHGSSAQLLARLRHVERRHLIRGLSSKVGRILRLGAH
jgi:SAM-dependent methyltransferase